MPAVSLLPTSRIRTTAGAAKFLLSIAGREPYAFRHGF
jgi:hypothetical protein